MPTLVSCDQTGFIKSRLAANNVRRLLHIVDAAVDVTVPAAVLSLDAMKAFDRLEWSFLWTVLEKKGFNWTKSALLPLNDSAKGLQFPAGIPVVRDFKYLRIQIFTSLNRTVTHTS